jgi:hypothetical protein
MSRYFNRLFFLLGAAVLLCGTPKAASAGVVLNDDFEGGSLSNTKWLVIGHGTIVADPLDPSNHVLAFTALGSGGDIFSVPLNLTGPLFNVSFDYLGLDGKSGVGADTGGFLIIDFPSSFFGHVVAGTSAAGGPTSPDMLNLQPGVWTHISITANPATFGFGNGSKLALEEWVGSPNTPENAFFDNIVVTTSPEPGSGQLMVAAMGLVAGMLVRRGIGSGDRRCRR